MKSLVIAVCLASAVVLWGVTAIGVWRVRRMYRAAGAPPEWYASGGWWMTSRLLSGFSIFTGVPLLIVASPWAYVVFGGWVVQTAAFVWATRMFGGESEGANGG